MKNLLYAIFFTALLTLGTSVSYAGIFISNVASGNWHAPGSWIIISDADGIPDLDDDVTILVGHNITCAVASNKCNTLDVQGTITINNNQTLYIRGNYNVDGNETGTGKVRFNPGLGGTITGSGTFGNNVGWIFTANAIKSISTTASITKSQITEIQLGSEVTNNSNITCGVVLAGGGSSTLINNTNATITLTKSNFMIGGIFDASANDNLVRMNVGGNLPITTGGIFNNLTIMAAVNSVTMNTPVTVTGNFSITGAGNLIQNGNNLSIAGNISKTGTGTLVQSGAEFLICNGSSSSQTITHAGTLNIRNIEIDNPNGVSVNTGTINLASILRLTNGDLTINGTANFTMLSTATETARIDEVTNGSQIIGNMTLQRFITGQGAGRDTTWADLASPVQISSFADWDAELLINYNAGNASTAYTFDEVADDFAAVSGAGQALIPGVGYEVFLADDFTLSSWSGATLTTVGTPNVGDQDLSGVVSFTNGNSNYNLVGNPFQSCINWAGVFAASSNIANSFEYYDYTAGTYSVGGGSDEIPTGQGFWILTTGSNPQFIIPESAKTTSSNSTLKSATVGLPYMTLALTSANGSHTYSHKLRIGAGENSNQSWDFNDHPFRPSPDKKAPAIYATTAEGKKAVIYAFGQELTEVVIPVSIKVGITGNYKITASNLDFVANYTCVTLVDKSTGRTYDLNAQQEVILENLESGVLYANRFEVRLSDADCSSPQHITGLFENDFDVIQNENQAIIHFHYAEATPVTIHVTNFIGQSIVTSFTYEAYENTCAISLPSDFSGGYLITVMKDDEPMTKKLIKY